MSNIMKESFFSIPIFYVDIENSQELNSKLTHDILQWKKEDEKGEHRSNNYGWHSQDEMHLRDEFANIKNFINYQLKSISLMEEYSLETDLVVQNMWANVSPKYAYNSYHYHPNCLWSGVYYVQCPSDCGRILFENKQWHTWSPIYEKELSQQPHQWDSVHYEAIEGRAIFFPSCIGHEVEQNLTDVEGQDGYRISISFNSLQIKKGWRPLLNV